MQTVNGKALRFGWPYKVGKKIRKFTFRGTQKTKGKVFEFVCVGGPFSGEKLKLREPSTLPFCLNGFRGRYIRQEDEKSTLWINL